MDEKVKRFREEIYEQFYDFNSVCSSGGMTGAMPTLPTDEEAMASYSEIQGIPKKQEKKV